MSFGEILWVFINPFEAISNVRDFVELGGNVLFVILLITIFLWGLIFERLRFFKTKFIPYRDKIYATWKARQDQTSWHAKQIKRALISNIKLTVNKNITSIKTVIALAPLLGLLGTVTGMVEVFDVMAITGSGNARAMAAGISKATLPTMAGLVVALSGIAFITLLERKAEKAIREAEGELNA